MKNPNIKKNLDVQTQMSRNSNGVWNIQISDKASGLFIMEISMNNDQFSDFMATSYGDGKATYYANPNIGKTMKTLNYGVDLKKLEGVFEDYKKQERDLKQVFDLAEEENPGFAADRERYNGHKRVSGSHSDRYFVILRKYE